VNGTKWHWLATFPKVSIADLQAQKGFKGPSRNRLVQSPTEAVWTIRSSVSVWGFRPQRTAAQTGTKWHWLATFWKVSIADP
jgi:hypothetical protein